jgi:hypothetical protein
MRSVDLLRCVRERPRHDISKIERAAALTGAKSRVCITPLASAIRGLLASKILGSPPGACFDGSGRSARLVLAFSPAAGATLPYSEPTDDGGVGKIINGANLANTNAH